MLLVSTVLFNKIPVDRIIAVKTCRAATCWRRALIHISSYIVIVLVNMSNLVLVVIYLSFSLFVVIVLRYAYSGDPAAGYPAHAG